MANEYFTRTPTSTGNRKVWTWAGWVKRNSEGSTVGLFGANGAANDTDLWESYFSSGNKLGIQGNSTNWRSTTRVLLEASAWYHIVIVYNSTSISASDRYKVFINGKQETDFATENNPSINALNGINQVAKHMIGARTVPNDYNEAQFNDVFLVDGQALTPDVFGFYKEGDGYQSFGTEKATDFRSGKWSPRSPKSIKHTINRSGGFGVNGFYLPMNDSSNPGADFHCTPNSIIKLKGEDLPQPRNGAPTTSDAYVSQLREEPGTLGFDGCIKCDGNDGLDVAANAALDLGTGDFTIEGFYYLNDLGSYHSLFDGRGSGGDGLYLSLFRDTSIDKLYLYANSAVRIDNIPLRYNEWMHVAICRSSGTTRAFIDGELAGSFSDTLDYISRNLLIGKSNIGNSLYGFISNFRIVKGTALYTSNFTRPTSPLENVANTILLCANSSTSATASTVTPSTITALGDAFATKNELTGSISLAVPGISTATGANLVTNGHFDSDLSGWTTVQATTTWKNGTLKMIPDSAVNGAVYQSFTTVVGKRYTASMEVTGAAATWGRMHIGTSTDIDSADKYTHTDNVAIQNVGAGKYLTSFTATTTSTVIWLEVGGGGQTQIDFDNVVVKQEDAPRDYSADIRGSGSNLTLTPSGNPGVGYELDGYYGSAMNFNATNVDEFNVAGSSSNGDLAFIERDFTIEAWVYPRVYNSGNMDWIGKNGGTSNTSEFEYGILADGTPTFYHGDGSSYSSSGNRGITLPAGTIPTGQWTHIATERHGNKWTVYINGVVKGVIPNFLGGGSMPTGTADLCIGNDSATSNNNWHWDGRVQDLRMYKGIAKYKGGFDVPKPYGPTTGAAGASIGIESWRTNSDTSTNNFATLNPQAKNTKYTLTNGNLKFDSSNNNWTGYVTATHGFRTGKWYWEMRVNVSTDYHMAGVVNTELSHHDIADAYAWGMVYQFDGRFYDEDGNTSNFSGGNPEATSVGDIVSFAIDMDAKEMWVAVNGTWIGGGNPSTGTSPNFNSTHGFADGPYYTPVFINYGSTSMQVNFGQNPTFCGTTSAGTDSDSSGKGLFKYLPPSGFLSLCSDNLPTPAIPDPGKHFKTVLWTGDGNVGRGITGVGFKPDLVWIKDRGDTSSHSLFDSVRGAGIWLGSDSNAAEQTGFVNVYNPSFDDDGFGVGTDGAVNGSGSPYVAWCWKAGDAAVINNDGTTTSQVSVNHTAGFSIVTYPGDGGSSTTVGHGLSKAPSFILSKNRGNTYGWPIYHQSTSNTGSPATDVVYLNENIVGNADNIRSVNDTTFAPTSWGGINQNTKEHIAYCWTEIEGYSKFGSYLGNGVGDGPFAYCGFRPAYVLIKNISATGEWCLWDSSRTPYNEMQNALRPNDNAAETNGFQFDFYSNGFKARDTESSVNTSGSRYIFAAFAESPFQTANAK